MGPDNRSAVTIKSGIALLCLTGLLLLSPQAHAQLNKCKIKGKIVYTDQDCPENTQKNLELQPLNTTPSGVTFSGSTRESQQNYRSATWYEDHRGYARALKLSREKGVPIFIYAYTDWCPYCKKLKKGLFADAGVKRALSGFIKVKLNPEHSAADKKLFKQWGGTGFPTLYVQQQPGSAPRRTSGPFSQHNGQWKLMKKSAFIAMLERSR